MRPSVSPTDWGSLSRAEFERPKNLLVFINPHGGKRKAAKVYREKVAPLLDLAGITTDVIGE